MSDDKTEPLTLEAALKELEGQHPFDASEELAKQDPNHTAVLTSAGEQKGKAVPALFASEELAISSWRDGVLAFLSHQKPSAVRLLEEPRLDRFQITVMQKSGMHRTAQDRFNVTCKFGLYWLNATTDESRPTDHLASLALDNSLSEAVSADRQAD